MAEKQFIKAQELLEDSFELGFRVLASGFKPGSNSSGCRPDYYVHETDKWLVFPHELTGLTPEEIARHKPKAARLIPVRG